ncbi:MAG: sugar ABC transporter permease [Candidatus Cloacimonetes bacterium]|nr:sugar ABC transporter permease [Candidatus Cloacimonadota bacterium]
MKTQWKISPYLYVLPALLLLFLFRTIPVIMSLVIGFFEWEITGSGSFIGVKNYSTMFADEVFWQSITNTIWFVLFVVPASIVFPLLFASLLNQIKRLKSLFRIMYFLPFVTSMVAVSIVWKIIFAEKAGLANTMLGIVGIAPQKWLAESTGIFQLLANTVNLQLPTWMAGPSLALVSIIIVTIWKGLGYNTIIYLAGLQNIPKDYYEAADIDGASKFKQFFKLTIPLVSPTTFYVLLMTTITSFQAFSQVYLMTDKGGPLNTTKLIVYYIYERGFDALDMGYASAVALFLFVILLLLTILQRRLERHVHY